MGDFEADTRLTGSSGRYTAEISRDWEIWGPYGGYMAALLLRAAGMHSSFDRPGTLSVHFLGSATFETATIEATSGLVGATGRVWATGDRLLASTT
ncbi:MAG: hypothetical protein DYH08_05305 [Actinobacteria bacterium ATB1]|nr:hypothetical protein [Actinobacteria bacterium ATB1]